MRLESLPIKRKIMAVMMLTCLVVVMLTVAAFMIYDLFTVRETMVRSLATQARIVSGNSTAALAFKIEQDAVEVLASLRAEPQVVAAALYDADGKIFAAYPTNAPAGTFPESPHRRGYSFEGRNLILSEPVSQGDVRLGVVFIRADMGIFYQRLWAYLGISMLIVLGSMAVAFLLSERLQSRISQPILALAATAKKVSEQRDYSVRATKVSADETGVLTDAFNQMLRRIQEQTVALQQSETRVRLALEASRIGTWERDLITGKLSADEYACALFGLTPQEFRDDFDAGFLPLIHPQDRPGVKQAIDEAIEQKKDFIYEYRAVWRDGSIHHLMSRGRAFYDTSGRAVRFSGVIQDITERKRAEAASQHLAAIVESSGDAIISKDLNGIIRSWNRGAEQLFGYTAQEAIGQPIFMIIASNREEEEQRILGRIRKGERIEPYETVRKRKDGTVLQVSLTVSPMRDQTGQITGASSIVRDITERIRAREALENHARLLREQAQMLDLANVMVRDLDGKIILWNTGMEKMYGWLRTETLGRSSQEVLRTRFPKPIEDIKAELLRNGRWEGELIHLRKDGRAITVASQWVLHKDEQGRPSAILEVNTDITDRKQAEQQMLRMNTELEQRVKERTSELVAANQELEAFTYSVAHDLRAPLRHIDAFAKILIDDFAREIPAPARRYLDNILKGSQNMSRLVDDLLNLARVGRQELKREMTPLNPIVDEVIADLKRETEQRAITWRVGKLPTVESDPGLMKQIFANLLSNAVKYTRPRKAALIEVGQMKIGDETVIFVRDNGVGFNMKYVDKLFGVFQRLHRADEFEGTGVGLATVERIVRKHGGHIWAEAEVEKGATFYFTVEGLDKPASVVGGAKMAERS